MIACADMQREETSRCFEDYEKSKLYYSERRNLLSAEQKQCLKQFLEFVCRYSEDDDNTTYALEAINKEYYLL